MSSSSHDDRDEPRQFQDKKDPDPRPDEPTTSDDATLVERGEGAHAEFSTAPESLADGPPPQDERPGPTEDDQR